jgi:hypothetical protein
MIRVVHPGSRIRMLAFSHPGTRIRGQKGTQSRIPDSGSGSATLAESKAESGFVTVDLETRN